jgi:ABC-2 type transport system permease protein
MSFKLLKPMDPFHQYLTQEIGLRVVVVAFLLPALVALTLLLPDLTYQLTPLEWVVAVAAALTGFFLNVLMAMTFATIGFWTTQAGNLYSLWWGVGAFLSGWIAPLALMPEIVADAAQVLPFRSSMGFPLEILLNRLTGAQIAQGFVVTAIWIVVFALLYRLGWRLGVRRYQAVGG